MKTLRPKDEPLVSLRPRKEPTINWKISYKEVYQRSGQRIIVNYVPKSKMIVFLISKKEHEL